MIDAITIEPLNATLRDAFDLATDPGRLAVVFSTGLGRAQRVLLATSDYHGAYAAAREFAAQLNTPVLTASSYRPTIVGADLMPGILANVDYAPLDPDTPHLLGMFSRHCPDCAAWLQRNTPDNHQWIAGRVLARDERGTLTVRGVRVLHTVRAAQLGEMADLVVVGDVVMWHPYAHRWDLAPEGLRPGPLPTR